MSTRTKGPGAGQIGSQLARLAVANGYPVVVTFPLKPYASARRAAARW
jgi:phosphoglycerate dehydrogenase-like enzyme